MRVHRSRRGKSIRASQILASALIEPLENRRLLSGGDITVITSDGIVAKTDPALAGPYESPLANSQVKDEVIGADGTRYEAGFANGNIFVAKYLPDNQLDTTFGGGDGVSTNDLGSPSDQALDLSLRPDGKINLTCVTGDNEQFVELRLNSDGSLDPTFATNGILFTGISRSPTFGGIANLLPDGRLHFTGSDGNGPKGMEWNADGKDGFDRMAAINSTLRANSATAPKFTMPLRGSLAWYARFAAQGPVATPPAVPTELLHANDSPQVDEGSTYSFPLQYGDGWDVQWDSSDPTTEHFNDHPATADHVYPDGPSTHTITATSNGVYLAATDTYTPNADSQTVTMDSLSIDPGGTLDLRNNDLVVNNANFSDIQALTFQGYRQGSDPTATGIISTTGQTAFGNPILAVINNALIGSPDYPFGSGHTISPNATIGKYTYFGDTNLDGQVTADDYQALDANFGATGIDPGVAWFTGDENFDGKVTADDYQTLDANFNLGVGNPLQTTGLLDHAVTLTQDVQVNNVAPTVEIPSPPTTGTLGTPLNFTSSVQDPSPTDQTAGFTYSWSVTKDGNAYNPGTDTTQSTFTFTPSDAGSYVVSLSATDKDGDASSSVANVSVNEELPFDVTYVSPDPESIFDIEEPVVTTFTRTSADTSQDLNIYYTFDPHPELGEGTPDVDFDPGSLAPGSADVYVFTIPAGSTSSDLQFDVLNDEFRGQNMSCLTLIQATNEGGVTVPLGVGKIPVTTKILITQQDGTVTQLGDTTSAGLKQALQNAANSGNLITDLRISGHGSEDSIDLANNGFLTTSTGGQQILTETGEDIAPLMKQSLAPSATVRLQACKTGNNPGSGGSGPKDDGSSSLAAEMSRGLSGRTVTGYKGTAHFMRGSNKVFGHTRSFKDGNKVGED